MTRQCDQQFILAKFILECARHDLGGKCVIDMEDVQAFLEVVKDVWDGEACEYFVCNDMKRNDGFIPMSDFLECNNLAIAEAALIQMVIIENGPAVQGIAQALDEAPDALFALMGK